ncbi:MAG: CotH kinase family protein, partial [bacterium]
MQKTKIIRFLLLLILIQALAMLYHSRQEIHAFIDAHFSKEIIKNGLKNFTFFKKDLPTIDTIEKMPLKEFRVDVPFANWRWVNATIAADTPRTKIPAKLHVDGKSLNCTIRVSFGAERHWIGERKSIRLRFPDVGLYKGIRELNLNIPETEMIIIDGVAWEFAKVLGLPTPEYDFVNLYINNHYEGVRLLYEDADGYFLERNGLMGYIFTEEKNHFPFHYESAEDSDYPTAKVINKKYGTLEELRHLCKVLSYPSDRQFQEQIVKLVDLPQIARWYAHALICGSGHQNVHNIKLFYNTALQKFQALPWDIAGFGHWGGWPGSVWQIWKMDLDWATNHLTYRLNMMPEFIEIRNHILWETLNGELSLENQLAIIDKYYKKIRYHVYTDNRRQASAHRFSIEDFENAIEYLKSWARKRHQFMIDELQKADLRVSYATLKNNTGSNSIKNATGHGEGIVLAIGTGLQSSVKLEKIIIPESGRPIEFKKIKIFFDKNANDKLDIEDYEISVLKRKTILDANGKALTFIVDQDLYPARKVY